MKNRLRIATRKSPLARWQANHVACAVQERFPQTRVEVIALTTTGDRLLGSQLHDHGGKGLFTKELEEALLRGDADFAVHSMKDVPVSLPDSLKLSSILARQDPADAFVSTDYACLEDLPRAARIGTSSLRRWCQLQHYFPEVCCVELRGNVGTRLERLHSKQYDAIILACAGLNRLGYAESTYVPIPYDICLPAIGQGALGIECRTDDHVLHEQLGFLNDTETAQCVQSERTVSRLLGGNCRLPIAAYACLQRNHIHLQARVGSPDGKTLLCATAQGTDPEQIGTEVANDLQQQGAGRILKSCLQ